MRKAIKLTAMLLAALMVGSGLSACKDDGGGDVSMDSDGNVRPGADGPTKITFWGYGDDNEISVFQQLVKDFNELYEGVIEVNYETKANDNYSESARMALRQNKAKVDILYVGDSDFKAYAELGYLEPLDEYLATSKEVVLEDMWETSVDRFKYDVETLHRTDLMHIIGEFLRT